MRRTVVIALLLAGCATPPVTPSATEAPSAVPSSAAPPSAAPSSAAPSPAVVHELADAVNEELREELLAMMAEDQATRTGVPLPGDDRTPEELMNAMGSVDAANSARMREILDEFGWPGWSLAGEDGALAAWVLIQHADLQLDLQKRGLAMLQAAVDADDASAGDLAYLVDRVRVAEGRPQLYGTQLGVDADGELIPRTPIEDEANVDARRAAAGLGTLEEYYEEFRSAAGPSPSPSAAP